MFLITRLVMYLPLNMHTLINNIQYKLYNNIQLNEFVLILIFWTVVQVYRLDGRSVSWFRRLSLSWKYLKKTHMKTHIKPS